MQVTCLRTERGLLKPRELRRCPKEADGVHMPGGGPSAPSSEVAAQSSSCCCVGSPFTAVTIAEAPALPAPAGTKSRTCLSLPQPWTCCNLREHTYKAGNCPAQLAIQSRMPESMPNVLELPKEFTT